MDLYQKDPNTLRRLLSKRQNPCTQIFKSQSSNSTSASMSAMNLVRNGAFTSQEESLPTFTIDNSSITHLQQQKTQFISSTNTNSTQSINSPSQMEEDDSNEGVPERVQKKIKTSMITTLPNEIIKPQRKFSYEESEHSTACDTHSEFNTTHETGDFMFSHSPSPSYSNPLETKLDDIEDHPIKSGLIHLNVVPEEEEEVPVSEMQEEISQQQSTVLTGEEDLPSCQNSKIKVRCTVNHQWEMEVGDDQSRKTCPRCQDLLEECRKFAEKHEGTCLNEAYDATIRYRCKKGHSWNLNHKNARRRWCAQCAKEQRVFLKKKCEEEKMEKEKEEEEFQKKLFEEARKKAATENGTQSSKPQGLNIGANQHKNQQKNSLAYFQRMDYEIENLAKKYTVQFMSQKEYAGDMNYQQILQVYKILIMPEEILQAYMFNLNADSLRSEFRRIAKIIHPDKNKHPQAGNTFLKIYKVYEKALSRFEGIQQKKI